jgi:hypothetical protein
MFCFSGSFIRKAVLGAVGALILPLVLLSSAQAATVNLAWNRNLEPNVTGYRLYYGTNPGSYTQQINVGNSISASVSGLTVGTNYFFATTAYDSLGIESPYSNEVSYTVPSQTPTPTPTPGGTPPVSIAGSISYCSNTSTAVVPGVALTLSGGGSGTTVSDGSGNYQFSSLPYGGNYIVTPSKAPNTPGSSGINTVDVIGIQRHFLGLGAPLSGCHLTAADASGGNGINTVDVIAVQRFFLGFTSGIGNTGKYQFSPTSRSYVGVTSDLTNQNYDTLILGDVASSFVYREGEGAEPPARSGAVAAVVLPEVAVDLSVSNFTVEVTATNINPADRLVGFQGDFTFDERVITFEDEPIQGAGLTADNWTLSANILPGEGPIRTLRISAFSNDLIPLSGSGTLFELKMIRANSVAGSSTELNWISSPHEFMFIDADLETQQPGEAMPGLVILEHQNP